MIYQRSILKEKITVTAVIFFTLFTITSVFFLIRFLKEASRGQFDVSLLLKVLGVGILGYLPLITVVTVLIAIITTLSRMYRESEMVVWQTSGVGALSIFKPVAMLVLPMFLFLMVINFMFCHGQA